MDLEEKLYLGLSGVGAAVDIIAIDTKTFEYAKDNRYLVYHQIDKYGKIVYEK